MVAGGGVDGCGAGPGGEVVAVGEPSAVAELDQQPSSAGGSDTVQAKQSRAGGSDQLDEFLVRCLLAQVETLQVSDQLGRDPLAGPTDHVPGPHSRQDLLGLRGGE